MLYLEGTLITATSGYYFARGKLRLQTHPRAF